MSVTIENKPRDADLKAAIAKVKLAEDWLERYSVAAGIPCRFHISEAHMNHPRIPLYVSINSKYGANGSGKLFLNHDKSRRDSSSTTACTIEDAMRAIDEAAAAYKAKVKK